MTRTQYSCLDIIDPAYVYPSSVGYAPWYRFVDISRIRHKQPFEVWIGQRSPEVPRADQSVESFHVGLKTDYQFTALSR